jgi:hypothetical protein
MRILAVRGVGRGGPRASGALREGGEGPHAAAEELVALLDRGNELVALALRHRAGIVLFFAGLLRRIRPRQRHGPLC